MCAETCKEKATVIVILCFNNIVKHFQDCMKMVFKDNECIKAYLDDIVIFSNSAEDHMERLHTVLERCLKYDLKFNCRKFKFFQTSIEWLGHTNIQTAQCLVPTPQISTLAR